MSADAIPHRDNAYRRGVGIMLLNSRGDVFVARRIDLTGEAWQMPQGGIDGHEEPRQAALRELREEIGTDRAEIIAESQKWLSYDLPRDLQGKAWGGRWRGQRQKWFVMRFQGSDADINLATEHPEFAAWKWIPVSELPSLVVSFKRQTYLDLLAEFPEFASSWHERLAELMAEPIIRLTMAADNIGEQELFALLRRVSANLRRTKP